MAANYAQGIFTPKHPEKYAGRRSIRYRSSWELAFFRFCDEHPSIIQWASESIRIPYKNPLNGRNTTYVPDLFIIYQDKDGQNHAELIEIKPSKEVAMESAKSRYDIARVAVNAAKWQAARAWSKIQGITFRVVTEHDLFANGRK
jgi:hypothetical protein